MKTQRHFAPAAMRLALAGSILAGSWAWAGTLEQVKDPPAKTRAAVNKGLGALPDALGPEQWAKMEASVDRALVWLAAQQQPNGSFPSAPSGQPAITSFCVLAFLSRGHQPGVGPYGKAMSRAIDFVMNCQQPDGLITYLVPESVHIHMGPSHTATYTHPIAGLMLTEVYGSTSGDQARRIKTTVEKALQVTRRMQVWPPKSNPVDDGGWRYVRRFSTASESDLSVTGWHLMFLRSAKNAEFNVPSELVDSAMAYVERCWDPSAGLFFYGLQGSDHHTSRAMMGAGVLSLSLGGKHQTEMARRAGDWMLAHPFSDYGLTIGYDDRFHYAAYYCSQAMAQLGGSYWERFFPTLVQTYLQHQSSDGSWASEDGEDAMYGKTYTTSLAVLALTPPFQLLPIYQR